MILAFLCAMVLAQGLATKPAATSPTTKPATQSATSPSSQPVKYNGRIVTEPWIQEQHKYFADKIIKVGDAYFDIGRKIVELTPAWPAGNALLRRAPTGMKFYRIYGSDGLWFVPVAGSTNTIPGYGTGHLLCIANTDANTRITANALLFVLQGKVERVEFTDQTGTKHSMSRDRLVQPLTVDEFREAISSGFKLFKYQKVMVTKRTGDFARAFQGPTYQVEEIQESPVK
jgi:hypothetical protein